MAGVFTGSFDRFLQLLADQRDVNITGRKGSGKSLLSYAIGEHLVKAKLVDGAIANLGCDLPLLNWREVLPPGYNFPVRFRGIEGALIWLDEAGTVLDNRTSMVNPTGLGRYGRKLRNYTILSSVTPVDKRYTHMQVLPGPKLAGRWQYEWALTDAKGTLQESGKFWLMNPGAYFGKFDTWAMPVDDCDILGLWEWTLAERLKHAPTKAQWFRERIVEPDDIRAIAAGRNTATIRGVNAGLAALVGAG